MGVTYVDGEVRGPGGETARVRFLVDSGATYTLLARDQWEVLGLTPTCTHVPMAMPIGGAP